MKRIAIIGPGAIGGTVIVRLAQTRDHSVIVCARSAVPQFKLEAPEGTMTATPEVLTSPQQAKPVDWVLVATKVYDVVPAAAWFQYLMGSETRLAVMQNGVEHIDRFAPYCRAPGFCRWWLTCRSNVKRLGTSASVAPGTLRFQQAPTGAEFARLFHKTGLEVTLTPDFQTALWSKLAVNCAGAISALVLKPALIAHRPPIADIMRSLVRECIAVGRAEGASLDDSLIDSVLDRYRNSPADSINSLHADRIAGKPMEIDARNGVIVRLGSKHGIPTPVNQMIVALLEATTTVV